MCFIFLKKLQILNLQIIDITLDWHVTISNYFNTDVDHVLDLCCQSILIMSTLIQWSYTLIVRCKYFFNGKYSFPHSNLSEKHKCQYLLGANISYGNKVQMFLFKNLHFLKGKIMTVYLYVFYRGKYCLFQVCILSRKTVTLFLF